MTRLTLNIIGTGIDLLLLAAPSPKSALQFSINNSSTIPQQNLMGWSNKEVKSPFSGHTHHYLYYPGPKSDAPVFLFLHGLVFDARNFLNMKKLSSKWQLIAYNFPETTELYRGDMNDFRFLLDDFLDTLKIDTLYLCGVSFGGGIAIRYAASHARRIKALVLASTFIMNSNKSDRIKSRQIARIFLKHPDHQLYWLIQKLLNNAMRGKKNPLAPLKDMIKIKNVEWYRQVIRSITTCEGPEDAMQISCPVLSLSGDKDKLITLRHAKSVKKHIPHCHSEIIEGGTHAMMYFKGEQLADMIHLFCSSIT